ncbi:MAG: A/G-specific adenine glycosylase [Ruminococcaceae bacterium]|nr:A/G-specific adenine glycosylase [Oscillospiraceae bacterium]MBQ3215973.1 A/G-specific adenine glycosylase [Oscillospiraceae bacterium]
MEKIFDRLPEALLPWYQQNKRDLPWRADREPYHIWLSEIMLQQTRVEAVKGYYCRFLDALPNIETLAQADDGLLHKLWEGLGYYSRVRNLKRAAQVIMERHGGRFPEEYAQVLALPGIGEYTAGAICSIAFHQGTPAVDGNVMRVVSRLTENATPIDDPSFKKRIRLALEKVYPAEAGAFTQALMELGATICGPNWKPKCEECPCQSFCGGAIHGTAERFPVKKPKISRRIEERTVFILYCEGKYALRKRPDTGLLAGLWQFPDVVGWLEPEAALEEVGRLSLRPKELRRQVHRKHVFTHIQWQLRGYYIEVAEPVGEFRWFTAEEINNEAALPTAYRQFWEEIEDV